MYKILFFLLTYQIGFSQSKKCLELYEKGKEALQKQNLGQASDFFQKSIIQDSLFANAHFQLGRVAELQKSVELATKSYQKSINLKPTEIQFLQAHQFLGLRHLRQNQFAEAKSYLQFCADNAKPNSPIQKQVKRQIEQCNFAIDAIKNPLSIEAKPLPKAINQKDFQYFPSLTADKQKIVFTARSAEGDENMYESKLQNGTWTNLTALSGLNSPLNEGTCSITADGKTMIFTACEGRQGLGSCDLYFSRFVDGRWTEPENLGTGVNSPFWESQPSLSADGQILFFSSDRPNGKGNKDIWVSKLLPNHVWSVAENLGDSINSPFDEISPFLHANGKTMFFSSNGHIGIGGFDIFISEHQQDIWTKPSNLGYPINNEKDQVGLVITADGEQAYFANDDKKTVLLYSFDVPTALQKRFQKASYLKGQIFDALTKQGLDAEIQLFDVSNNERVARIQSDKLGNYTNVLPNGGKYALYVSKNSYFFKSLSFDYSLKADGEGKVLDISLEPIRKNVTETLNNLFFDSGSWNLKPESLTELQKITEILKQNINLKVEFAAHTDDIGTDTDNLQLSQKRANAVSNALNQAGIQSDRLKAMGYGESQPKYPNTSEENRRLNRRIEMRIL